MNIIDVFLRLFGVYSLFLIIFGTITNLISVFVCLRRNLRKNPTFVFFAFMLAFDTLTLYQYNLSGFYKPFHNGIVLEHLSETWCKVSPMLQIFALHASVWFLVAVSFERLLCIKVKRWRKDWFNVNKTICVALIIMLLSFAISLPSAFAGQLIPNSENISINASDDLIRTPVDLVCSYDTVTLNTLWLMNFTYSVIPFITLLVINYVLIRAITQDKTLIHRTTQCRIRRKQLSISIIVITFVFMILTSPNTIMATLFLERLSKTQSGSLILLVTSCIGFSYHSSNFVVLMLTNKHFSNELKDVFKSITKSNRVHNGHIP